MSINSFENYPISWKPVVDKTRKTLYRMLTKQLENRRMELSILFY